MATDHVASSDGTTIAYRTGGSGEPVLFVHGTAASSSDWVFVARLLRDRVTTITFDRRGRGKSGVGTEPYSIAQEAGDIAAVAAETGARTVVAHSYGALCTMVAVDRGLELDRLVLYEPPAAVPRGTFGPDSALAKHVAAGEHEAAAALFLGAANASRAELDAVRSSPAWPSIVATVPTLLRELHEVQEWTTPAGPFDLPALLLVGAETRAPAYLDGIPDIAQAFPRLRREELPGQRHLGHVMAAEDFAAAVARFLA